nr:hypothetical protein [Armatimonas sp.]
MGWIKVTYNKPDENASNEQNPGSPTAGRISPLGKVILVVLLGGLLVGCYFGYEANRHSPLRWLFLVLGMPLIRGILAVLKAKDFEKDSQ